MSQIAEAALYGDLVNYLRDQWAEQAAQFNETAVAEERARIDELIRAWFFTPQADLHGLTPRQVIRNEELDVPNSIPHDHLPEVFDDDCPICQMLRNEALNGEGGEWHFGIAPDHSLLDEYDPEGQEAYWRERERRLDEEQRQRPKLEARQWLTENPSPHCFAGNRFYDSKEALDFANRLYEMGAVNVWVDNILDEPWRIAEQGGAYADTFVVELPADRGARARLWEVFEHELGEQQGLDLGQYTAGDSLIFWWD